MATERGAKGAGAVTGYVQEAGQTAAEAAQAADERTSETAGEAVGLVKKAGQSAAGTAKQGTEKVGQVAGQVKGAVTGKETHVAEGEDEVKTIYAATF